MNLSNYLPTECLNAGSVNMFENKTENIAEGRVTHK